MRSAGTSTGSNSNGFTTVISLRMEKILTTIGWGNFWDAPENPNGREEGLSGRIGQLETDNITLFPNPAKDYFTLDLRAYENDIQSIHVFDNAGRELYGKSTSGAKSPYRGNSNERLAARRVYRRRSKRGWNEQCEAADCCRISTPVSKILIPLPSYGFDPSECAIPWSILRKHNIDISFAHTRWQESPC